MQEISTRSPGLKAVTPGADAVDDADALVAEDAAGRAGGDVALQDVQVRAADGGLERFDDGVAGRLDLRLGPVFERLFAGTLVDESFHGWLRSRALLTCRRPPPSLMASDAGCGTRGRAQKPPVALTRIKAIANGRWIAMAPRRNPA